MLDTFYFFRPRLSAVVVVVCDVVMPRALSTGYSRLLVNFREESSGGIARFSRLEFQRIARWPLGFPVSIKKKTKLAERAGWKIETGRRFRIFHPVG